MPETYAVFKGRLLDLIYDRAVQIQPAAALQAGGTLPAGPDRVLLGPPLIEIVYFG